MLMKKVLETGCTQTLGHSQLLYCFLGGTFLLSLLAYLDDRNDKRKNNAHPAL